MRKILILLILIAACVLLVAAIHSHIKGNVPAPALSPQADIKLEAPPMAASQPSGPEPALRPVAPPAPSLLARVLAGEDIPQGEAPPAGVPMPPITPMDYKSQTPQTYLDRVLDGQTISENEKPVRQ